LIKWFLALEGDTLNYALKNLLSISKFHDLLNSQDEEYSLPAAIIDMDDNILTSASWPDICSKFHRANQVSQKMCIACHADSRAENYEEMQPLVYRCPMGLIIAAMPIIIGGKHLGNVFAGHCFLKPPDEKYFINQARQYGFDECEYLEALRKVPILAEKRIRSYLAFIAKLTQLFAEQGLQNLQNDRIENDLQKSEERFRSYIENADDIIFSLTQEGVFTYVSPNWKDAFGYDLDEVIGKSFTLFVHPDDIANCLSALSSVVSTGQKRKNIEYRVLCKNGSFIWYSANGSRLHDVINGEISFLGIGRDNSEQRNLVRSLRSSESHYRSIFETALIGVAVTDKDFNYTDVNEALCKLLGYKKEEIIYKASVYDITHPDDIAEGIAVLNKIKNGEIDHYIIKKRYISKSGETITAMAFAKGKFSPDGEYEGATGSVMDISGLLKAEEERLQLERQFLQAQKLESLGIMAGGIAHDFNNLLQIILGNLELAARELSPDSTTHNFIVDSIIAGNRAANLCDLMLTYVGKGLISKHELSLNELVSENAEMLKTAVSSAVTMKLHLSEKIPTTLANASQMQQLVMNLLTNASESIVKQPGLIVITTGVQNCDDAFLAGNLLGEKPEPGQYVFIEISDNGCGMSEKTLQRLFDPFFTTKFAGRGLGMSAVLGIMKSHSGALFVDSEPGRGTTFKVIFPASAPVMPANIQEPVSLPYGKFISPDKPLSGVALLADDEKPVLKTCSKMLNMCGFKVITACDGIDAVAKFREHSDVIDLVLLDLTMPNMDGIAAMKEIYDIKPVAKIILSSGFNEDELGKLITSQPPAGFIRKPYSMNEIETELRRVIQG
jgi:PAS domain S-box-containing protein